MHGPEIWRRQQDALHVHVGLNFALAHFPTSLYPTARDLHRRLGSYFTLK